MSTFRVRRDRAEVMGVAAIILERVAREFGFESCLVPGVGIRDGVILDLAEASVETLAAAREHPVLQRSVLCSSTRAQCAACRSSARSRGAFVPCTRRATRASKAVQRDLQLAALLHDVGEVAHRKNHHKHSEYLITRGRIPGLDSPIRELVAATARAHRKSLASQRKHRGFANLEPAQQPQVLKMAVLLRIADTLSDRRPLYRDKPGCVWTISAGIESACGAMAAL